MGYREEMEFLIDADGLVGRGPIGTNLRETHRTGGNQLLETFTDLVIRKKLNLLEEKDLYRIQKAVGKCEVQKGVYDKNPPLKGERRKDVVAFDDYIGISCGSKISGALKFHFDISEHGLKTGWIFNNDADIKFTERSKPWHITVYRLNAGQTEFVWLERFLFEQWLGTEVKYNSTSGIRLRWLVCEAIRSIPDEVVLHPTFKSTVEAYMRSLNLAGGIKKVFKEYHGESHPFAKYGDFV